jgi:hypothetical protein
MATSVVESLLCAIECETVRYIIAVFCIGVIAARAIWPELRFDNISLALLVVAVVASLLPELRGALGRVKKVKVGDVEVELGEKLKALAGKTEAVESSLAQEKRQPIIPEATDDEVSIWLTSAGSDPRAALLLLAIEIEKTARELATAAEIPQSSRPYPLSKQLAVLAERQVIDPRIVPLFQDFWSIRNSVVHGHHFELSEGKLYELVEFGLRILRLLRTGSGPLQSGLDAASPESNFINPWEVEIPKIDIDNDKQ